MSRRGRAGFFSSPPLPFSATAPLLRLLSLLLVGTVVVLAVSTNYLYDGDADADGLVVEFKGTSKELLQRGADGQRPYVVKFYSPYCVSFVLAELASLALLVLVRPG